jgi:hypothetical protein
MSLSPDIWCSYPLYIRNEYSQEIEETNQIITQTNPIKAHLAKSQLEQPTLNIPEQHYGRVDLAPKYKGKNHHFNGSPRQEAQTIASDHQRLLKEREQRFLRNRHTGSERKFEPYQRQPQQEEPQRVRNYEERYDRREDHEEEKYYDRDYHGERKQEYNSPEDREREHEQDIRTPPRQPVRKQESPRESYSLVPPESAYFKVDEPSVEHEDVEMPYNSPTKDSNMPEVGSSFERRAKTADNFNNRKTNELRSYHRKTPDQRDSSEDQQSSHKHQSPSSVDKNRLHELYMKQHSKDKLQYKPRGFPQEAYGLPYPPPSTLPYPTNLPQNMIYQTPDGKFLSFQNQIPVGGILVRPSDDQESSDSRTETTPSKEEKSEFIEDDHRRHFQRRQEDERRGYKDKFDRRDHRREDERKEYDRRIPQEYLVHKSVQQQQDDSLIPPYKKPIGSKYAAPTSKLTELYKRREGDFEPKPDVMIRQFSPPKQTLRAKGQEQIQSNILGQRRINAAQTKPQNSTIRPDPIDIDDGLAESIENSNRNKLEDPEDLQRAYMAGLRKPDNEPMSLHRFRNEIKGDIDNQEHADDIDKLSDSNYSIVEQAYKDMDDFDYKVDQHHHDKKYFNRVADVRAHGQKSHNSMFAYGRQPKNVIRY